MRVPRSGARTLAALEKADLTIVEHVLNRLSDGGDKALLSIPGFGRKGLIDVKKALRSRGFELPGEEMSESEAS